jgi:parvulin-like peptidyl-prolyl isomerase
MADEYATVAATLYGEEVSLHDLLYFAKIHEKTALVTEIVQAMLITQAATRAGLSVGAEELQAAAEEFRRTRRLYRASDTLRWLNERHMVTRDLETRLEQMLLTKKLQEHITGGQVERYFAEHRADFESARIAQIVVDKEGMAHELWCQLVEEDGDFASLARRYSQDQTSREAGGYVGIVYRQTVSPEIEAAIFTAQSGAMIGPVRTENRYHIVQVQALYPALLDTPTTTEIRQRLFADWLRSEVNRARMTIPLWGQV